MPLGKRARECNQGRFRSVFPLAIPAQQVTLCMQATAPASHSQGGTIQYPANSQSISQPERGATPFQARPYLDKTGHCKAAITAGSQHIVSVPPRVLWPDLVDITEGKFSNAPVHLLLIMICVACINQGAHLSFPINLKAVTCSAESKSQDFCVLPSLVL